MKNTHTPKFPGRMNLAELEKVVAQAREAGLDDRSVITVRVSFKGGIKEISVDGDTLSPVPYRSPFDTDDRHEITGH